MSLPSSPHLHSVVLPARARNVQRHSRVTLFALCAEYLGAFGTDAVAWSHSWGVLDAGTRDPKFSRLQCGNFVFLSLPRWPASVSAHSMFQPSRSAGDQHAGSSSSGEIWRARSISGNCRVCDRSAAASQAEACGDDALSNQCSAMCEVLPFEYDYKTDSLAITRPTCDASSCSSLSDEDAIKLIKPHVTQHSTQRVDLQAIQTRFEDAESSNSSLKAYMCERNHARVERKVTQAQGQCAFETT